MPRANTGPRLVLYGPDDRFGARPKRGFTRYIWYIVWSEKGNKGEQSTDIDRESDGDGGRGAAEAALEAFLIARRVERERSDQTGPRGPDAYKIGEALARYADEHAPSVADPARISYAIAALTRFWGELPVIAINKATCSSYRAHREREFARAEDARIAGQLAKGNKPKPARKLSSATTRRELGTLQAALKHCVACGYTYNVPPVTLPEKTEPRDRWLTRAEVGRLLRHARRVKRSSDHLPLFILLGVYTGARREAICALQWVENLEGGWIDLDRLKIDFQGGARVTKKKRVKVNIPHRLVKFLRAARKNTRQYVIEHQGEKLGNPNKALQAAATAAGLGKITAHVLRHTAVTWLVQEGVNLGKIAQYVGMTEEMIQRVYGHHDPANFSEIERVHR